MTKAEQKARELVNRYWGKGGLVDFDLETAITQALLELEEEAAYVCSVLSKSNNVRAGFSRPTAEGLGALIRALLRPKDDQVS